jgi:hypothetical protein
VPHLSHGLRRMGHFAFGANPGARFHPERTETSFAVSA